ncbi:hypothetical protein BDK51DRAFT_32296 [Blyttiomyces helicus]|uniref:Uncharacterized protein n=1 Tax=Blyttiomyces helicus TaxID=388810 RepID=A0A4P9W7R6_9FUNG|nr:hypothetical protein BDK51DRAFT_32296 [Blyttiomyces helicus]|eukprot:RKO88529.1 hypothetical protein BDK51DRAFT_32296 [Blyttiomyces helicus]
MKFTLLILAIAAFGKYSNGQGEGGIYRDLRLVRLTPMPFHSLMPPPTIWIFLANEPSLLPQSPLSPVNAARIVAVLAIVISDQGREANPLYVQQSSDPASFAPHGYPKLGAMSKSRAFLIERNVEHS